MSHSCQRNLCTTPHYEETEMPEVKEMQCPLGQFIGCMAWMDQNEFGVHLATCHPDYEEDPGPWFEEERERLFGTP